MPARQPFTTLCRTLARPRHVGRADLHLHTTFSDGTYTPAQVVELARRSGLSAIAITDHDTLDGIASAQTAARGSGVEIVTGVEITAEQDSRELHLLGFFVRLDDAALRAALRRLCEHRVKRYNAMLDRLRECGVALDVAATCQGSLGRRTLAEALVTAGKAATVRDAFFRYLRDNGHIAVPKLRLPAGEAIALVRGAGGVASWAHPPYHGLRASLPGLRDLGLQAIEVEYPSTRAGRSREMRTWAAELGMAVTGGSDCHGPEPLGRTVGACTISADDLDNLRRLV